MKMHFWGLLFVCPIWWDFGCLAPTGTLMDRGTGILWTGGEGSGSTRSINLLKYISPARCCKDLPASY